MSAQRKAHNRRPKSPEEQQFYKDCSYRLGVLRRHLGHTPQSFAAGLGMTVRAYIAYERGERTGRQSAETCVNSNSPYVMCFSGRVS